MDFVLECRKYAVVLILVRCSPRSQAKLRELESLSLPGHRCKITSLGHGLSGMISLTSLDLSRNSITSLRGLKSLGQLAHLNLYYNAVAELGAVEHLRHNLELRSLDLRLNPCTRSSPDYRARVIHALPWLQRLGTMLAVTTLPLLWPVVSILCGKH